MPRKPKPPKPDPVPIPEPVPVPEPPTDGTTIPSSIDATGSSDVTSQLTDFINSLPDGSTCQFPRQAKYRCDNVLEVINKNNFVIAGNDSLLTAGPTDNGQRANFRVVNGSGITVKNLTTKGGAPSRPLMTAFVDTLQWQHGFDFRGVNGLTLNNVETTDIYGDGYYFGIGSGGVPCRAVNANNWRVRRNGRQGIAAVHVDGLRMEFGLATEIALMTFNIEPNPECSVKNVVFADNQAGTGPRQQLLGIVGHGPVDGVALLRTTCAGKPITVWCDSASDFRIKNVTVQGNKSDTTLTRGYVVDATSVDGLSVSDNVQPLNGAQWNHTVDCTNVAFSGNTP